MRRLRPILLNFAAGASAALLLVTIVLWVRSYAVAETITRDESTLLAFNSADGAAGFTYQDRAALAASGYRFRGWSYLSGPAVPRTRARPGPGTVFHLDRFGFTAAYGRRPVAASFYGRSLPYRSTLTLRLPYWFIAILCLYLPARAFLYRAATRAGPRDRCRVCNYDLRATPDRCPECGAVPI